MRKVFVLAAVGIMLLTAGFAIAVQAQDVPPPEPLTDPPYLAEYYNAWVNSPHADYTAEAFVHWNEDGEVPTQCAKCHTETGYLDYLGADGSAAGAVDVAAAIGSVVSCNTCHDPVARDQTEVTFPSGVTITDDGGSARCMHCHQGRASTVSVNAAIENVGLTGSPDTVDAELGFINIHYYAAAASLYGSEVMGGYQYDGMVYQMQNQHVEGYNTCASCHDPHTLEVKVTECATCHEDVETVEDLRFIRMQGSGSDYDGDEDTFEGISEEIEGLQELLYEAMQQYSSSIAGSPIVYDTHSHPYFFIDTNENGEPDEDEINGDNKYVSFTPNLLEAAYNYQVSLKDPGGYAHNPQYHIHLLYDSITALNTALGDDAVDMEFAQRNDPGHFNVTAEAFRHWDEDGEVAATCVRCHTATGLPFYLENGVTIAMEPTNSLTCSTCHDAMPEFTQRAVEEVRFPSGAVVSFGEGDPNNLCISCHQGRESTVSVNTSITRANVGDDEVADGLTFRNVHYFAAGASLFGTEVQGAYEFEGQEYNGRNWHDGEEATTCADCHDVHTGENDLNLCSDCHEDVEEPEDVRLIRMLDDVELIDYDGDGDAEEPIADEIASFREALYAAMQTYAADTVGVALVYDTHSHPYFFIDTNGDGITDADEVNGDNRYATFTPNLLRAAYNYQFSLKDPGAFAHNPDYIMQIMYDGIVAVGGDVSSFTRPPVQVSESE